MLRAQLLPELAADLVAALPELQRDYLARHLLVTVLLLSSPSDIWFLNFSRTGVLGVTLEEPVVPI